MIAIRKMIAMRKKLSLVFLGVSLSACDAAMTQGVSQATQGLLPQVVQGAMPGATQNSSTGAENTTSGALAQVAASMLPSATQAAPSAIQPSPALANSSEVSFFSKTGLQACGGGALAGVVTCKLTKTCDSDKGALNAAILGCGIGIGANYYIDYQRSQYADAEQRLDALIADVRADNQKLQNLTVQAQQVLSQDKNTLASIQQGIKRKTLEKSQAQAQVVQIDANTQTLNKTLADLKSRHQQWQDVAKSERGQSPKAEALDAEISRMQKQIVTLQQNVDNVAQQRTALALG